MRKLIGTLFIVATMAALAACGGSSNKAATSNSSTSASSSGSALSSASSAGVADKGAFCKQIIDNKAENISDDPNGAKQALAIFSALTPPDEIKGQWDDYLNALKEFAATSSDDQSKLGSIAVKHAQSLSQVSLFISQSCLNISGSELSDLSSSLSSFSSGN